MTLFDSVAVGEILRFRDFSTGKAKYHLCVLVDEAADTRTFVFVNTYRRDYEDQYVVEAARMPLKLPTSETGFSAISFARPQPINRRAFRLLVPHKTFGFISPDLARDLAAYSRYVAEKQREAKRLMFASALNEAAGTVCLKHAA